MLNDEKLCIVRLNISIMFAVLRRKFGEVDLDHVAPPNTTVILQCKPPGGSPIPNITWYKNDEPLFFWRGRRVRVNAKGDLLIRRLRTNDTGEYQCVAENMVARREGLVIRLVVRGLSFSYFFLQADVRKTVIRTKTKL